MHICSACQCTPHLNVEANHISNIRKFAKKSLFERLAFLCPWLCLLPASLQHQFRSGGLAFTELKEEGDPKRSSSLSRAMTTC